MRMYIEGKAIWKPLTRPHWHGSFALMNEVSKSKRDAVDGLLKAAWEIVESLGLPEDLRLFAFQEALTRLEPNGKLETSIAHDKPEGMEESRSDGVIALSEREMLKRVSEGTGANLDELEQLVYLDDGVPRISRPGIKLGRNNAERTRAVASILAICGTFSSEEDEIPVELVREEAQRLKVYDPANFAAHLKALPGFVVKGSGPNRRLQARATAIDNFAELVSSLAGEE